MFSKQTTLSIGLAGTIAFGASAAVNAAVIDVYFSMNFVAAESSLPNPLNPFELDLVDITYLGGGGATYSTAMPVFPGTYDDGSTPRSGLPDMEGLSFAPTYTTVPNGDGETTRTIDATVPINWDTSGAYPQIWIKSIRVAGPAVGGTWTVAFAYPYYTVGLIPAGTDTELTSLLSAPQGDIYDQLAGAAGNPIGTAMATSAPPGLEGYVGSSFGNFIFAAAPVPVPAAVWLFGSGLLGLVGITPRRNRSRVQ